MRQILVSVKQAKEALSVSQQKENGLQQFFKTQDNQFRISSKVSQRLVFIQYASTSLTKVNESTLLGRGQADMPVIECCGYFLTNTLWIFSEGFFFKGPKICSKYMRPLLDP